MIIELVNTALLFLILCVLSAINRNLILTRSIIVSWKDREIKPPRSPHLSEPSETARRLM